MKLCVLALDYGGTGAAISPVGCARCLDYPLALEVHALEERCRKKRDPALVPAIASAIRGRYDLTSDDEVPCAKESA